MRWLRRSKPDEDSHRRLLALERRVNELEAKYSGIDVEWSEWYDKYRRLYARLAKRVSDDRKRDGDTPEAPTPPVLNPLAARLLDSSPLLRRSNE